MVAALSPLLNGFFAFERYFPSVEPIICKCFQFELFYRFVVVYRTNYTACRKSKERCILIFDKECPIICQILWPKETH